MTGLTQGSLVAWQDGADEHLGVVSALTGQQVTVQFDGFEDVRIFKRSAGIVRRVGLGGSVRRVSTGEIGTIQSQESADPPRWQVSLVTQSRRFRNVICGRTCSWTLLPGSAPAPWCTGAALAGAHGAPISPGRVEPRPHHAGRVPCRHSSPTRCRSSTGSSRTTRTGSCSATRSVSGKTIEAGLILKELRARRQRRAGARHRAAEPHPAVAVRAQDQVQRAFSILNTETVRYLAVHAGRGRQPVRALRQRHRLELVDHRRRVGEARHRGGLGHGDRRRGPPRPGPPYAATRRARPGSTGSSESSSHPTRSRSGRRCSSPPRRCSSTPASCTRSSSSSTRRCSRPRSTSTDHRDEVPGLSRLVHDLSIRRLPDRRTRRGRCRSSESPTGSTSTPDEAARQLRAGPEGVDAVCEELSARHLLPRS